MTIHINLSMGAALNVTDLLPPEANHKINKNSFHEFLFIFLFLAPERV